ncbi:hypothetical protein IWQ62_001357 [Dispira parvispora]|uniref:Uncharacterized protein n=1 Tax=Dispira parvispora TaxID=1520584 RepID=A0A9W8ATR9_9FUNG|nr:hypothetical protein IWQ62_001357 [Dispira parvispora]
MYTHSRIYGLYLHRLLLAAVLCVFPLSLASLVPNSFMVGLQDASDGLLPSTTLHHRFLNTLADLHIPHRVVYNYSRVYTGVSILVSSNYADFINTLPEVHAVVPNQLTSPDYIHRLVPRNGVAYSAKRQLAHDSTGYYEFMKQHPNIRGQGVKVGIIDSGLDYHHPAFGNCYKTSGCRIQYGHDFVGDDFNGTNTAQPDDDPRDTCNGHGTHVAGILAGDDGEFQGLAPEATLGVYRVIGCEGNSNTDIIVKALEQAHKDGMQVINMSVGTPSGTGMEVDSRTSGIYVRYGMLIVSSAGNAGTYSMWMNNAPATGPGVISVASSEPNEYYSLCITDHSNGDKNIVRSSTQDLSIPTDFKHQPLTRAKDTNGTDQACTPLTQSLKGKVALIQRGGCKVNTKAQHAMEAGAIALLIYNNEGDVVNTFNVDDTIKIPVVCIEKSSGDDFVKRLGEGQGITLSSDENLIAVPSARPATVSYFSSWGPSTSLELKPTITAPGNQIYSTLPLNMGRYGIQSGTSMASPYVAGCLALLCQLMPNGAVPEYASYLRATASVLKSDKSGFILSLAQQGSGLIDMSSVANALNFHFRSSLWLWDISDPPGGKQFQLFNISLINRGEVVYYLNTTYETAEQVTPFTPERTVNSEPFRRYEKMDMTNIRTNRSTLEPGKELRHSYRVTIDKLPDDEFWIVGGRVVVSLTDPQDNSFQLSFPFIGMKGILSELPILPPVNNPLYPQLIDPLTKEPITENGTRTFSMEEDDFPVLRYRLQYTISITNIYITYNARSVDTDKVYEKNETAHFGHAYDLIRNFEDNDFYTFNWTGLLNNAVGLPSNAGKDSLYLTVRWDAPYVSGDKSTKVITWKSPTFNIQHFSRSPLRGIPDMRVPKPPQSIST